MRPGTILTDLDGTLLEPGGRLGRDARTAVEALRADGVPLVLLTSKTELELRRWRTVLSPGGAGSFENGAGVVTREGTVHVFPSAVPLFRLRDVLTAVSAATGLALSAADRMSREELARRTGLEDEDLTAMLARQYDIPFVAPDGAAAALEAAVRAAPDVRLTRGGLFWHLLGAHDKADAVAWLLEREAIRRPLVGLGDSENDAGFLALCDVAVVVPGASGASPALLAAVAGARVAPRPFGSGWAAAVGELLSGDV